MAYELQNVQGVKDVKYIAAPFDVITEAFEENGLRLLSAAQFAQKRIKSGIDSPLFSNGSWVKEGLLYVPKSDHRINLVRKSFVLANPKEAVSAHKNGKEFFVDEKTALEYIEANKNEVLALDNLNPIPTNRFGEDERTVWLFEKNAQKYGEVLSERIKEMPLRFDGDGYINNQGKPYASQLRLGSLDDYSLVLGYYGSLLYYGRAFGVPSGSAAGATRAKNTTTPKLPYTKEQVDNAIKTLQGVRTGELPASKLEKIVLFLEEL